MAGTLEASRCGYNGSTGWRGWVRTTWHPQELISNHTLAVPQSDLCFKACAVAGQGADWGEGRQLARATDS